MKKNEYYEGIHTRRRVRSLLWGFNHTGSHFEYGAAFALGETSKNHKKDGENLANNGVMDLFQDNKVGYNQLQCFLINFKPKLCVRKSK